MAAAGLLLPTLAASSNFGGGNRIRTSVNIDIHRRSRVQCEIPQSPIISSSAGNKEKGIKKGEL